MNIHNFKNFIGLLLTIVFEPILAEAPTPFAKTTIRLEQNVSDGDLEAVIEVQGSGEGLNTLIVTAPGGRRVINFTGSGTPGLGIRQFTFESPEPKEIESVKAAYPEGSYLFRGVSPSGTPVEGKAVLSHKLPPPVTLMHPKAGAQNVGIEALKIEWIPQKDLSACLLSIEQEDSGGILSVRLPGSSRLFTVPREFLAPSTEYTLSIGAVSKDGNISFIETTFATK